ncbi:MAG: aspartate--tRNA ligase [Actinomycetota bacterium]
MHEYRSHTCAELRPEHDGSSIRLSGWIQTTRDHGGVVFVDLRDHYGITQIVIPPDRPELQDQVRSLSRESVIRVGGTVSMRPENTVNPELATGEIEVMTGDVTVLGKVSRLLPFEVTSGATVGEEPRLRHRFLDLRTERMQRNVKMRTAVINSIRRRMESNDFLEIQTPILTNSSPEGARDYLVPSRRYPGKFYALPQAPQQFKQLLMVSGFDRYFQIAPCFRDEDGRADRSPGEFYQLDLEMSFATQEDVFAVVEDVLGGVFTEFAPEGHVVDTAPFVRLTYAESLAKYGNDKPDLRNPLVITDLTDTFADSEFRAFAGKTVRAIAIPGGGAQPRSFFDSMIEFVQSLQGPGMAWLKVGDDGELAGPIAKFIAEDAAAEMRTKAALSPGDAIVFLAGPEAQATSLAGHVRNEVGVRLDLLEKGVFRFCWIVDYPMFEAEDDGSIEFSHNPFSMPQGEMKALLEQDPLDVLAHQYDLVCNGYELSSGAVRNHDPEIMLKAFEIAGYPPEEVETRFPALLNAFQYGAPPHAGIAPGIDRILMLLLGEVFIRDVIPFPMTVGGLDLLMGAPSKVTDLQKAELHIESVLPPEDDDED